MAYAEMKMPVKPEMEMEDEMEMEGEMEGAEATPAIDLAPVSDEEILAEAKKRGLI